MHNENVVEREQTYGVQQTVTGGGTPGAGDGLDVGLSFGGNNPHWSGNLDVDFTAIAALYFSSSIARVIWIGHIKSLDGDEISQAEGGHDELEPLIGISSLSQVQRV